MNQEIIRYCLDRKPKGAEDPTWTELSAEVENKFNYKVSSIAGLRSRVSEARRSEEANLTYVPGKGVVVPKSEYWGDGLAPLVEPATQATWETVVFLSDFHLPYHNEGLIQATVDFCADIEPDRIILNGDLNDFFQLSRFNKSHEREDTLQEELDLRYQLYEAYREACPDAVIDETLGNHDDRLLTYIKINAKSLHTLRVLKPHSLLRHNEYEINHYGRAGFRLRPEFVVEHGHVVRRDAGASAKSRLTDTMISGIMGHTHRMADYQKSGYRRLSWYEQGCLCNPYPDYVVGETNWQPGIAVGHFHTRNANKFNVELVKALGNGFIFGGIEYGDTEFDPYPELSTINELV